MLLRRTIPATCALLAFFGISALSYAQQSDQDRDRMKSTRQSSITGCLVKGESSDQYVLTNPDTGDKIVVTGPAELEKHAANHTVKLTGTPSDDGKTFTAVRVQHISDTCQSSK